ncbi:AraC family transcriptional regulator [Leucothrix sargassi]|nr:AraC family transcriptional regulator [Leucothrix sargassi]
MDRLSTLLRHFHPEIENVNYYEMDAKQRTQHNSAPAADIYLLTKGSLTLVLDSGETKKIDNQGLFWLPCGASHRVVTGSSPAEFIHGRLRFGSVNLNPLIDSLGQVVMLRADEIATQEMHPVIELITTESRSPRCGKAVILNHLMEVLLVKLLRYLMSQMVFGSGLMGGLSDARLARSITAMHDKPELPWSVQTLAQEAGMSRTAFSTHFRDVVGYSPMEYLGLWRMRLASEWLSNTDESIGQIGEKLGYGNEAAFRRAFRKIVGYPPGKLRKKVAEAV